MEDLEYITKGALMMCDQGAAPDFFKPTFNTKTKIYDCLVATKIDFVPLVNVPSFKICAKTQKPCIPITTPWLDTWQVKINGQDTLIGRCTCKCGLGGTIEFMTSGQQFLPDDAIQEVKDFQEQAQKELDDSGNGDSVGEAGFVEGMIPVWGSGRDLVNAVQTGDGWGMAINAGFLVWDCASIVAGVFSFGSGTVAMQAGKAGLKGAIKAGAKKISKKALTQLGKTSFKKLSKEALKKSIDKFALNSFKTCVFACFPAGTPINTEYGVKNIEDIIVGDRVWAYDQETGKTALRKVVYTMQRESDHTLKIYTEQETIETTALHPFYVNDEWKDASELKPGDLLLTKDKQKIEVKEIEFCYQPKKVFNFEVDAWHTYFVGLLMILVHNAKGRCLTQLVKKVGNNTYDIILKYKKGWTNAQKKAAKQKTQALTKANTKVVKNPPRKSGTKKTFEKSGGKVKKGEDVDHTIDLQLNGPDNSSNMNGLDQSVNRSLGSQIRHRIKDLPANTKIRKVKIR